MAIYHMSVKTFSRSKGQSATAAAAYRSGEKLIDMTTGQIHDYTRKDGVDFAQVVTPNKEMPAWANQQNREQIWNEAEKAETRKNSTVAREFVIALPSELDPIERLQLATEFAQELVNRHGFIADVAIHKPNRAGDERNHHAHILCTTRRIGADGFTEKTRELDDFKSGEVVYWRERWQDLTNEYLTNALTPTDARVTCKSFREQGITDQIPQIHYGVHVIGYERRTGEKSELRKEFTDLKRSLTPAILDKLDAESAEYDIEREIRNLEIERDQAPEPQVREPVGLVRLKHIEPVIEPPESEPEPRMSIAEQVLENGKANKIGYNVASEYNSVCYEAKEMNPVRVESRVFGDDPPNSPTMIYQFEDGSILKAKVYEPCAVLDVGRENDPTSSHERDFDM